jgi:manganese oxidase
MRNNAMLLRWEINEAGSVFLNPLSTPAPTGVTFQTPDEILAGAFPPSSSELPTALFHLSP